MHKYIIFRTEGEDPQWEERKLQPSGSLTWIIAEHWDSRPNASIPEPGYRPDIFIKVDDSDPLGGNTHYKKSDWEVTRVETYPCENPGSQYDTIVICYCQYNPINAPLKMMPQRQVSIDSFGGDNEAYQAWLASQQETSVV